MKPNEPMNDVAEQEQEPPRLDLSSLDPSRDEARWDRLVKNLAEKASAAHRRRRELSVAGQALAWAKPVLAAALVLVAATWVLAATRARPPLSAAVADTSASAPAALRVARWANEDTAPDPTTILVVLSEGAEDGGY